MWYVVFVYFKEVRLSKEHQALTHDLPRSPNLDNLLSCFVHIVCMACLTFRKYYWICGKMYYFNAVMWVQYRPEAKRTIDELLHFERGFPVLLVELRRYISLEMRNVML